MRTRCKNTLHHGDELIGTRIHSHTTHSLTHTLRHQSKGAHYLHWPQTKKKNLTKLSLFFIIITAAQVFQLRSPSRQLHLWELDPSPQIWLFWTSEGIRWQTRGSGLDPCAASSALRCTAQVFCHLNVKAMNKNISLFVFGDAFKSSSFIKICSLGIHTVTWISQCKMFLKYIEQSVSFLVSLSPPPQKKSRENGWELVTHISNFSFLILSSFLHIYDPGEGYLWYFGAAEEIWNSRCWASGLFAADLAQSMRYLTRLKFRLLSSPGTLLVGAGIVRVMCERLHSV